MKHLITSAVVSGLLLAVSPPVLAQDEEGQPDRERQLELQAERAILELFQDLELGEQNDDVDPRKRILEERERLEEIQRRIMALQLQQRRGPELIQLQQAAEPVQLDPKPYVNPFAERSRDVVLAALNHEKFAVRQSAEAHLLTDNTLSVDALKGLIKQTNSPEQHQRLLRIAEHHVMRELRERDFGPQNQPAEDGGIVPGRPAARPASVGYSYEPVMAHENPHAPLAGVRVIATMPGFPGHAHLRQGDIIVQIAGQGLNQNHQHHDITSWVRWRIAAHEAGDTMSVTLLRSGELLKVELVCAEGMALDHMYTTDAFEAAARKAPYKQAWEKTRDELVAEMPKPKTLTPKPIDVKD